MTEGAYDMLFGTPGEKDVAKELKAINKEAQSAAGAEALFTDNQSETDTSLELPVSAKDFDDSNSETSEQLSKLHPASKTKP